MTSIVRLAPLVAAVLVAFASCESTGGGAVPAPNREQILHTVVFWFADDATPKDVRDLEREVLAVARGFEGTAWAFAGGAVASDRPVVDDTFDVYLSILFDDVEAERTWADYGPHRALVEHYGPGLERVVIFDAAAR